MPAPLKWFPFYVDDWETDEKVDSLTLEEQGAYLCLLRWQWREGSISGRPADVAAKLEFDHVLPLIAGGKSTVDNVVRACRRCNRRKRNRGAP